MTSPVTIGHTAGGWHVWQAGSTSVCGRWSLPTRRRIPVYADGPVTCPECRAVLGHSLTPDPARWRAAAVIRPPGRSMLHRVTPGDGAGVSLCGQALLSEEATRQMRVLPVVCGMCCRIAILRRLEAPGTIPRRWRGGMSHGETS